MRARPNVEASFPYLSTSEARCPEIATSILAELNAAKNGVTLPDAMRIAGC